MIVYDHHFNSNEWSVLIGLVIGITTVIVLPKRFPRKTAILFFMCGVYSGFFFDHSLSVEPISFYDVNDKSSYQLIDFISYIAFGPNSYVFFYIYDRFNSISAPIYILIWTIFDIGIEWFATRVGIYHYRHGYNLFFSFPIYLLVNSCWIGFYNRMIKQVKKETGEVKSMQ